MEGISSADSSDKGDEMTTTTCDHKHVKMIGDVPVCYDCEAPEYINPTDCAKLIRSALKSAFPGCKFGVTTSKYSMGASISVRYSDGPPVSAVEEIAGQFSGASFDGMQDMKTYHASIHNGRPVRYGADYVFVRREYAPDAFAHMVQLLSERWEPRTGSAYGDKMDYERAAHTILARLDSRWETPERAIAKYLQHGS